MTLPQETPEFVVELDPETAPPETTLPEAALEESAPRARNPLASSPKRFINRELSWLAFNELVLEESTNPRHPLLERLRFVSISANNLDEFYMVRVAGLKAQVREGVRTLSQDGLSPGEQLVQIDAQTSRLMALQQSILQGLRVELASEGLRLMEAGEVTGAETCPGSIAVETRSVTGPEPAGA